MQSLHLLIAMTLTLISGSVYSVDPGPGIVTLYFSSEISTPFIHFNAGDGWTTPPGNPMQVSSNESFPTPPWSVISIPANQLTFVLNDGKGNWIHAPNGGNFQIDAPGIYSLKNGVIDTIQVYPKACPENCSGRGVCQKDSFICICNSGFFGEACQGECPGSAKNPCYGHGSCNDGASGNGLCVCDSPWETCRGNPECSTNIMNDDGNCGGCGKQCVITEGVVAANCTQGKCDVKCDAGYSLCYGSCIKGDHCSKPPLPGCQIFDNNNCQGDETETPEAYEASRWWTPEKGAEGYLPSYQDFSRLVGHAHVEYSSDRTAATVEIKVIHRDTNAKFTYFFNGAEQDSNILTVDKSLSSILKVKVVASDGAELELPELDFVWNAAPIKERDGDYRNGQKGGILELFGWPHADIMQECETLGKLGWLGVKVFPSQEQVMSYQPFNNVLNPWHFMYQPVSYRLEGRMGDRSTLKKLIQTCRSYGVRIYQDAVVNHMVGCGNDANLQHRYDSGGSCITWPNKTSSAEGPSPFYTQCNAFTFNPISGQPPMQEFPSVPYGPTDFHCNRPLNSWNSPLILNAGWLVGLTDLNTERDNVQERIADYFTDLIGIGFSGFRIDAAKHIQPDDLVAIFTKFKRNMGGSLPDDFITWWEILLGGEAEMLMCNKDSGYNYGEYLVNAFKKAGFTDAEIDKIKIWNSGYPSEPFADCGSISRVRSVIQNDDHDQQNPGSSSRDMHDKGSVLVKEKNVEKHRGFEVILFENPFSVTDNDNEYPIRLLLSSYYWPENGAMGIPDGKSECSRCTTTCDGCQDVPYRQAFDPSSRGYDNPQFNQYTRTHRDEAIINAMRGWMHLPPFHW